MRKFVVVNSRPKFSHVGSPGMNVGGWAKTSRGGLNEVDIIQKKGKAACSPKRFLSSIARWQRNSTRFIASNLIPNFPCRNRWLKNGSRWEPSGRKTRGR